LSIAVLPKQANWELAAWGEKASPWTAARLRKSRPQHALAAGGAANLLVSLVSVEEAFKNLKGDLAIRPIFHQHAARIEAHIFIAFLAYCLHVTLARRLHALAPGLTPRSAIEKFAAVQMIDLHIPTTDGRELLLTRYTEPEPELALLLDKLKFVLPAQPEPKISAAQIAPSSPV
jgi:hypothetical protein